MLSLLNIIPIASLLLYLTLFLSLSYSTRSLLKARDEGIQDFKAPGNKTELSFVFWQSTYPLVGGFEFGNKLFLRLLTVLRAFNGDISFGLGVIRPTFTFNPNDAPEDRYVHFSVIRDNVVEGQEIGQLQIAPSTLFDGFTPLFQNLRIIVNDANCESS